MSAVLSVQRFGNPAGQPAIFSKMEMQLSPFLDATFWNYCLQKTMLDGVFTIGFLSFSSWFPFVANPVMQLFSAWITESAHCICNGSYPMIHT